MNDRIGELLRFDPLDAAERITGNSYKEDESTSALGMLMHMDHGQRKEDALKATGDTYFGISFEDALRVFESEGFAIVLDEPFNGTTWGDQPAPAERFVVMWNPLGILLHVETYGGNRINGGGMNYCIRFKDDGSRPAGVTSSSKYVGDVVVGHHDVREGFRYNLGRLRDAGTFISPWVGRMMFSLVNYSVKSDRDTETARVIALLPAHVQAAIAASSSLLPGGES